MKKNSKRTLRTVIDQLFVLPDRFDELMIINKDNLKTAGVKSFIDIGGKRITIATDAKPEFDAMDKLIIDAFGDK